MKVHYLLSFNSRLDPLQAAALCVNWSIEEEHGVWAAFLSRYGKFITQVHFENGGYVLLANDKVGMPTQSDLPRDRVFQLRILQK